MRLLLDEMISPRIARTLRTNGYDVAAVAEDATLRAMSDDALLETRRLSRSLSLATSPTSLVFISNGIAAASVITAW